MVAAGSVCDEPVGGSGGQPRKKEEKRGKLACDDIVILFCYSPCWASQSMGPPLVCSPHPTEKGWSTCLRRGEGLAAAIPD